MKVDVANATTLSVIVGLGLLGLCCCITLPFHNDDAALYAHIARTMLDSGDWINIVVDGEAWLDKPHLHFWIHAVFMALLESSEWVFRLPLLISVLYACYYLFRLVQVHARQVATAAPLLIAVLYVPLIVMEGRAEAYAMLALTGGIFHLSRWLDDRLLMDVVWTSTFLALGMLTKGPFVPLLTVGTIVIVSLHRGTFVRLLHFHILVLLVLFALFLLPELVALWLQFGGQAITPKYGEGQTTALQWFLWDSQFGRYGAGRDNDASSGDLTYYLHTALWALFPFGLLLWWAMVAQVRRGVSLLSSIPAVVIILFLLPFSLSSFQLPHYLVTVCPFVIWLVIEAIDEYSTSRVLVLSAAISSIVAMAVGIAVGILEFRQLQPMSVVMIPIVALTVLMMRSLTRRWYVDTHLYAAYLVQVSLIAVVIPTIVEHQREQRLADYLNQNYDGNCIVVHGHVSHRLDYYLTAPICSRSIDNGVMQDLSADAVHVFTLLSQAEADRLASRYLSTHQQSHADMEKDLGLLWSPDALAAERSLMVVVPPFVE